MKITKNRVQGVQGSSVGEEKGFWGVLLKKKGNGMVE
jgi:hypothetical protein